MLSSNAREQCSDAQQGGIGTDGRTDELTKSLGHLTGDNTSSVTRTRTYEDSSLAIDVLFDLRERLARAGETTALTHVDAEIEWRQAA